MRKRRLMIKDQGGQVLLEYVLVLVLVVLALILVFKSSGMEDAVSKRGGSISNLIVNSPQ